MKSYSEEELVDFETEIAEIFNAGKIRAPVHLYSGNEKNMLDVFKGINEKDWIFCSWRSHYQCLLKGVPRDQIMREVVAGKSISLCFPEYRIFSTAIVGGAIPIAVGAALDIKRSGRDGEMVHCFMGDMTAETGIAHECIKYSRNMELPIRFVVEDNGLSVCTDTRTAWGASELTYERDDMEGYVYFYKYVLRYPHAGAGKRIQF
jgi:TPP-dependent pyruvate/acetoin dehydrogenase alpha subunit